MLLAVSIAPVRAGESATYAAPDSVAAAGECGLSHRLDSACGTVEGER